MATRIRMIHPETGVVKDGFYGFSWTSFFFGGFPAVFRGDIGSGLAVLAFSLLIVIPTFGIGPLVLFIVWGFVYNKRYTVGLLEKGYKFDDVPERVAEAKAKLRIL